MCKQKNILVFVLLLFQTLFSQETAFEIKSYVNDTVSMFTEGERNTLESKLKDYEITTTNQVVVVVINSLNNELLEGFANKLFNENGIGQEKEDNGVLLLIVKEDRKVRIEVGYGLEDILTDAKSSRIIREIITPNFKNKNYFSYLLE